MFSFENIYKAYKLCRKNKSNSLNTIEFEINLTNNLWQLCHELREGRYQIGTSLCFLSHTPKLREIFAPSFRDRVVHHLLVSMLEEMYESKLIYDVYNNRKDKGTHRAVKRAKRFTLSHSYYLQLDIKGFFYHLNKDILYAILYEDIKKYATKYPYSDIAKYQNEILILSYQIIKHDPCQDYIFKGDQRALEALPPHKSLFKIPSNRGLAIGNLTSQFFANVYMNRFDHFIKRQLKVKYIRYVDDFVLFGQDEDILLSYKKEIEDYLSRYLALELREDSRLSKVSDGLDFLGYIIRPHYILSRQRVVNAFKQKKAQFLEKNFSKSRYCSYEEALKFKSINASFYGHLKHANSHKLMQKYQIKEWL